MFFEPVDVGCGIGNLSHRNYQRMHLHIPRSSNLHLSSPEQYITCDGRSAVLSLMVVLHRLSFVGLQEISYT